MSLKWKMEPVELAGRLQSGLVNYSVLTINPSQGIEPHYTI